MYLKKKKKSKTNISQKTKLIAFKIALGRQKKNIYIFTYIYTFF